MKILKTLSLLILFIINTVFAFELSKSEKISDFNQLIATMKSGYGPLQYKKEKLGIDIDQLIVQYTPKIELSESNKDFYYLILQFVNEFHDGHFGAKVPTDHAAKVYFIANWVDGKALIESIDRKKLPVEKFPFEKGDEVVEINGISVTDFLSETKKYVTSGFGQTEEANTVYYLTRRRGSRVPVPENKKVQYKIRRGLSNVIEVVDLEWTYSGTPLDESLDFKNDFSFKRISKMERVTNLSVKSMYRDIFGKDLDSSYHCSGDTRIAIPTDATIIMKKPFVAYYHKTLKGNIGYLRIPHYSPENAQGEREPELRFSQYEYAVSELEKNTVGLVIDQDHNCGGSVSYLHQIVSLFARKPFAQMDFELVASKREFLDYNKWIIPELEHTLEQQAGKKIMAKVKEAWLKGSFLTEKTPIWGDRMINPNYIVYTKPILMLIDFWAGSGGDAFPSLMQGIGRAKLMGTRTSGLGGHVEMQPALNYSGITYRMTKSLFYRPDGVAVENNGAVPNIEYTITRDDFLYEFKNYQQTYLEEIFKMIELEQ